MSTDNKITELEKQIRYHNNLYWNKNAPEISDEDYDLLVTELLLIDPRNGVPFEFSEKVVGKPVKHSPPMLSMDKVYSANEVKQTVEKWEGDTVTVSYKMDGAACSLLYENGKLIRAATRGKGDVGEDITQAVLLIENVPRTIPYKQRVEIRGEVIMPSSIFEKYFKDQYAHPRNLAAGTLKREKQNKDESRGLKFYAYNALHTWAKNEIDKFRFLKENGIEFVPIASVQKKDILKILEKFTNVKSKLDFGVDGLIITAGSIEVQESMGYTSHHPRFAVALKYQGESGITVLKDVDWSISRTGVITPVAHIEPITLSGATITKVSLHHAGFIKSLGISYGCRVKVTRRGEVIPHIEEVVTPGSRPVEIPKTVNGMETYMDGDFLYLKNKNVSVEVLVGRISHFVKALEIDGLGEKIIRQLCDLGLIKDLDDLFTLDVDEMDLKVDRLGKKNSTKIVANIQAKRELPLGLFLRSLGIEELGKNVSNIIDGECNNLDEVFALKESDLSSIDSIGNTIAASVVDGLLQSKQLIGKLTKHITIKKVEKSKGPFSGQSFVFTGAMQQMKRNEAQKKVLALGGETPSGVKKDLTYLVVGGDESSSKKEKAEEYNKSGSNIKIISEEDFIKMI